MVSGYIKQNIPKRCDDDSADDWTGPTSSFVCVCVIVCVWVCVCEVRDSVKQRVTGWWTLISAERNSLTTLLPGKNTKTDRQQRQSDKRSKTFAVNHFQKRRRRSVASLFHHISELYKVRLLTVKANGFFLALKSNYNFTIYTSVCSPKHYFRKMNFAEIRTVMKWDFHYIIIVTLRIHYNL